MAIPIVLAFVGLIVFLAVTSPAAPGCGHAAGLRGPAVAQYRGCQAAPGPQSR